MRKTIVLYDKPIQIGFAILDISKVIVNRLYYILKKHYENVIVLNTDTHSLKTILYGKNVYNIQGIEEIFNTSNFDKNTNKPLKQNQNEKKLCLFKFENSDNPMCELIALAAKSCREIFPDGSTSLKAKGYKHGYKKYYSR